MYDRNARKLVLAARVFTDSASRATNEGIEGGSEFKAEFEQACRAKAIRLYELPPGAHRSTAPSGDTMDVALRYHSISYVLISDSGLSSSPERL